MPTVLIVDDDSSIRAVVSVNLQASGFCVLEATNGDLALEIVDREHVDIVVLDVMMPGKNGWEVTRELRADDTLANVAIIMLTAIGEKVNEMTSPLYGADEYHDKPFDFAELETRIKRVLASQQSKS